MKTGSKTKTNSRAIQCIRIRFNIAGFMQNIDLFLVVFTNIPTLCCINFLLNMGN